MIYKLCQMKVSIKDSPKMANRALLLLVLFASGLIATGHVLLGEPNCPEHPDSCPSCHEVEELNEKICNYHFGKFREHFTNEMFHYSEYCNFSC